MPNSEKKITEISTNEVRTPPPPPLNQWSCTLPLSFYIRNVALQIYNFTIEYKSSWSSRLIFGIKTILFCCAGKAKAPSAFRDSTQPHIFNSTKHKPQKSKVWECPQFTFVFWTRCIQYSKNITNNWDEESSRFIFLTKKKKHLLKCF